MDARRLLEVGEVVCVVRFRRPAVIEPPNDWYNGSTPPANFSVLHQVTLRKERLSPSGKLIAMDGSQGDQLHGWFWLDSLEVVEVLGVKEGDKVVPLPAETLKLASG